MSTGPAMKTGRRPGSLYERDPYTWALEQARALRGHRAAALDWDNLAEELGDLAARHADGLKSHCWVLSSTLLKLIYAPAQLRRNNRRLWVNTARNERIEIKELLGANPGLKSRAAELFTKAWLLGRNDALGKLNLEDDLIPQICPWSFDQAMDETFWPKPDESSKTMLASKPDRTERQ